MNQAMIIEGFICPECQQDMSSIELLQTHFELFHLNNNKQDKSNNSFNSNTKTLTSNPNSDTSLSSVFAKAKTLIASNDSDSSYSNNINNSVSNSNNSYKISNKCLKEYFGEKQQNGHFKSYTQEFRKLRDNSIGRYVVQTNKLLITLDKLISIDLNVLNSENDREIHYKSVVAWVNDKDVNLCPNCAKGFNLLNRKHHCRLCGAIMCNRCSQFISFTLAKQLTDPDTFVKSLSLKNTDEKNVEDNCSEFKLRRADSITSLNSYFFNKNSNKNENEVSNKFSPAITNTNNKSNPDQVFLRLCFNCGLALEKKYKQLKDKTIRSQFAVLYDELHSSISEAKRLYPVFNEMAKSLNIGESIYQLSNAEDVRHNLIRLFQQIESLSGRILKYGISEEQREDNQVQPNLLNDQVKLQRNIRFYAINYLKENSFNLSSLPNKEEYEKLKAQRQFYLREEIKRLELEQLQQKKLFNEQLARRNQNDNKIKNNKPVKVSIDNSDGWIPSVNPTVLLENDSDNEFKANNNNNINSNNDSTSDQASNSLDDDGSKSVGSLRVSEQDRALRIQIQLVENYLQDAIKHNKKEEADILRKNLNELLNTLVGK